MTSEPRLWCTCFPEQLSGWGGTIPAMVNRRCPEHGLKAPPPPAPGLNGRWVLLGDVGVDGAACGITDPVFGESKSMPAGVKTPQAGEFGSGVQFWCGFGDGSYDVWGWVVDYGEDGQVDERIAQVTITFIDQVDLDAWRSA